MSKKYSGEYNERIAFPLGGIGAGMICLEGRGGLSEVSVRNQPNFFFEPCMFSALCVKSEKNIAKIIEGPVARWKVFGTPSSGNGLHGKSYGIPRFASAEFESRFPFATVNFEDAKVPLKVELTGWSPFIPGDADNSSIPVAALEYKFTNTSSEKVEAVYSFNSSNWARTKSGKSRVLELPGGFACWEPGEDDKPADNNAFAACVDDPDVIVDHAWFRGAWFDSMTLIWNDIERGTPVAKPPITDDVSLGATLYVPFTLGPGKSKTIRLMLSWYTPNTTITAGEVLEGQEVCNCSGGCCEDKEPAKPTHKPWYSGRFASVSDVAYYFRKNYDMLKQKSVAFSDAFFDTTLPEEVVEAVEANLGILKSPTCLRQPDGRMWCWEGCREDSGCCSGSCTHVWNYAQAMPHLFPDLERTLRETEFKDSQDEHGHQTFRASLPIRETPHKAHAAADGQLGGIIKFYREWRISGDTEWMKSFWPKVKISMDYCIELWDPEHEGVLKEPHHNTYDIEFWGADGMCTSFYLGALKAAIAMGETVGDDVALYKELLDKGLKYMDTELWNGEYYIQKVQWEGLRAGNPLEFKTMMVGAYSPEAQEILKKEGPKYQYGNGCISDGVIGFWMSETAGLGKFGNLDRIKSHLNAIHKYNLKHDLTEHVNPQRPGYALGDEGGLLLCSWPAGDKLSLPFVYSDEVWTGIEYQVAAHLMLHGMVDEGLEIVRIARERYDGWKRNPYDEYECGHWYARAMSSYSLLQGLTGAKYDAVDKVLYIEPMIKGDFRSFLCTATGYATVGVKDGKPFCEVKSGDIKIEKIEYTAA